MSATPSSTREKFTEASDKVCWRSINRNYALDGDGDGEGRVPLRHGGGVATHREMTPRRRRCGVSGTRRRAVERLAGTKRERLMRVGLDA
jgi:hypothetical protein